MPPPDQNTVDILEVQDIPGPADPYTTKLGDAEEEKYQQWRKSLPSNLQDESDYDLRGAFKAGEGQAGNGHMTDRFKKPNHPTFSDESMYNGVNGAQGGHWDEKNGVTSFTPGKTNLDTHGEQGLRDYFKRSEPNVQLQLPNSNPHEVQIETMQDLPDQPPQQSGWWDTFKNDVDATAQSLGGAATSMASGLYQFGKNFAEHPVETTKVGAAGAAEATLGLSQAIFDTPETATRMAETLEQGWRDNGLPDWSNPYTFPKMVFGAIARGSDATIDVPGLGKQYLWPGTNATSEQIGDATEKLADIFPSYAQLGAKGKEVDDATKALIQGEPELMKRVAADPQAWAAFIGQGLPSLVAAWRSGGSTTFMGWLEAMSQARSIEDYEKLTGEKVSPANFSTSVLLVGTVNAFLEKFGLESVLGKVTSKGGPVGHLIQAVVGEGGTEALQQINQNAADLIYDPEKQSRAMDAIENGKWKPFFEDMMSGVVASAMGGAGAGGVAGAGSMGLERLAQRNTRERVNAGDLTEDQARDLGLEKVPLTRELFDKFGEDRANTEPLTDNEIYTLANAGMIAPTTSPTGDHTWYLVKKGMDEKRRFEPEVELPQAEHITMEGDVFHVEHALIEDIKDDVQNRALFSIKKPEEETKRETTQRLERAANYAQTSEKNELPAPSEAQIEAGNYRKGHLRFQGLDISIENPKGSVRKGPRYEQTMADHYGYIRGTVGRDKDHIDAFVGPNAYSQQVFVINQNNARGTFDEHKVMLGYTSAEDAVKAYHANYPEGWGGFRNVVPMSMDEFKEWLGSDMTKMPVLEKNARETLERATPVEVPAMTETPVARGEPFTFDREAAAKKFKDDFANMERGGVVTTSDGRAVRLNRGGADKLQSHFADPRIRQVWPAMRELIHNAVPIVSRPSRTKGVKAVHQYAARVKIGGVDHFVKITLREANDGRVSFYDADVTPASEMNTETSRGRGFSLAEWWQKTEPKAFISEKARGPRTNEGKGLHQHVVRGIAKIVMTHMREVPDLNVVQAFEDLPLHLQALFVGDKSTVTGIYDQGGATESVYLIANNMDDGQQVIETVLHEYVGHYGLRAVLGASYNDFMDEVYEAFPDQVKEAARVQDLDWTDEAQRRIAAEEFIAYTSQSLLNKKSIPAKLKEIFTRLVQELKRLLDASMGKDTKLTEKQLWDVIREAHDYVTKPGGYAREVHRGARRSVNQPYFYSQLFKFLNDDPAKQRTVEEWQKHIGTPPELGPPTKDTKGTVKRAIVKQGSGAIGNGKIKEEEVHWSGLRQFLESVTWDSALKQVPQIWSSPAAAYIPREILQAYQAYQEALHAHAVAVQQRDSYDENDPKVEKELEDKLVDTNGVADQAMNVWSKFANQRPPKLSKEIIMAFVQNSGVQLEIEPGSATRQIANQAEIDAAKKALRDWQIKYLERTPDEPKRPSSGDVELSEEDVRDIEEKLDEEFENAPPDISRNNWDEEDTDNIDEDDYLEAFSRHIDDLEDFDSQDYENYLDNAKREHGWDDRYSEEEHEQLKQAKATEDMGGEPVDEDGDRISVPEGFDWDGTPLDEIEQEARQSYREDLEQSHADDFRSDYEQEHTVYRWSVGDRYDITRSGPDHDDGGATYEVYDHVDDNNLGTFSRVRRVNEALDSDWTERRDNRKQELEEARLKELQEEYDERQAAREEALDAEEQAALDAENDRRRRLGLPDLTATATLAEREKAGQLVLGNIEPAGPPPPPEIPEPIYKLTPRPVHGSYVLPGGKDYNEWLLTWKNPPQGTQYTHGHWSEKRNFIVHVRWDVREDMDGQPAILVDELQSDWHKDLIKHGARGDTAALTRRLQELQADYRAQIPALLERIKQWPMTAALANELRNKPRENWRNQYRGAEVMSLLESYEYDASRQQRYIDDMRWSKRRDLEDKYWREAEIAHREARRQGNTQAEMPTWDEIERRAGGEVQSWVPEDIPDEFKSQSWGEWITHMAEGDQFDADMASPTMRMRIAMVYNELARDVAAKKMLEWTRDDALISTHMGNILDEAAGLGERYEKAQYGKPPAPFENTWPVLALKALIREAVNRGHKTIFMNVGELHGLRWGGGALVPGITWHARSQTESPPGWGTIGDEFTAEQIEKEKRGELNPNDQIVEVKPSKITDTRYGAQQPLLLKVSDLAKNIGSDAAQLIKEQIKNGSTVGEIDAMKDLGRPLGLMYPVADQEAAKRLTGSREVYNAITPALMNKWLKPFKSQMKLGLVKQFGAGRSFNSTSGYGGSRAVRTVAGPNTADPMAGYLVRQVTPEEKAREGFDEPQRVWWALFSPAGQIYWDSVGEDPSRANRKLDEIRMSKVAEGDAFEAWEIKITPELEQAAKQGFPLFMKKYPSVTLNTAIKKAETDIFPPEPTGIQRITKKLDRLVNMTSKMAKFQQAWVDQFAGIKYAIREVYGEDLPAEESGYKQAHFTTSTDGQLYALLNHGMFTWYDGITQIKPDSKGLLEILEPVADHINEWGYWMAARRAQRLKAEGRENLFDDATIQGLLELEIYHPEFVDVAVEYAKWKGEFLDWAQGAGVIDPITRGLWENADHVPFYRIKADELGGAFSRQSGFAGPRGIANQFNPIRRLKGGKEPLGNILENIVMNLSHILTTTMKNRAAALTVENLKDSGLISPVKGYEFMSKELIDMGDLKRKLKAAGVDPAAMPQDALNAMRQMWTVQAPKGADVISILVGGKKKYYHVHDETLFRALTAINQARFSSSIGRILMAPFRFTKHLISSGITLAPGYMFANWIRDTPQSWVNSRYGKAPRFDRSVTAVSKAFRESKEMVAIMAAGGAFYSGYVNAMRPNATTKAMRRSLRKKGFRDSILDAPWKLFDFYQALGAAAENSNRIAQNYIPAREAGRSVGEAVWESKDALNFAKHGDLAVVQFLAQTVFAFNARVQGLVRIGQSFKDAPGRTALRALLYTFASLALYLSFKDDDRYKELSEDDKDLYHHFWLGKHHYRIPKAFELGQLFGTIPERMTEFFTSHADDRGKLAIDRTAFIFNQVFQLWDPVTVVPAPNLVQPEIERRFNYDFFKRGPIIPDYLSEIAGAAPELSYDERTSPAIREMVKHAPRFLPNDFRNPMMVQHEIEGYTGTVGSTVLMMVDDLVRKAFDYPPRPALAWSQYPVTGRFYRADDPPIRSKYEDVIYSVRKAARGIDNAIRQMDEREYTNEEIEKFEQSPSTYSSRYSNVEVSDSAKAMKSSFKALNQIYKEVNEIWLDPQMSPTEKLQKLNQLYREKANEAKEAYKERPGTDRMPEDIGGIIDNIRGLRPDEAARKLQALDKPATADLVASLPRVTSRSFADTLKNA